MIIPARLSKAAQTSAGQLEQRARVIAHYRDWYRSVRIYLRLVRLNLSDDPLPTVLSWSI
jgi:hypothetical protein